MPVPPVTGTEYGHCEAPFLGAEAISNPVIARRRVRADVAISEKYSGIASSLVRFADLLLAMTGSSGQHIWTVC